MVVAVVHGDARVKFTKEGVGPSLEQTAELILEQAHSVDSKRFSLRFLRTRLASKT